MNNLLNLKKQVVQIFDGYIEATQQQQIEKQRADELEKNLKI